ncbi:hypothetical protein AMATHDRAFT_65362 [Amanita thiersii Skay4041]|uniref:C2H2-type domain-containing protein n=1 Tax=Amanita thiersii Skay4041 TaxID=703135 RepID=A0A2A9NL73_9AGAR|nr:hypothetical protein AMATHDRAFT_65362 [Amanita thiersii Skay4041]
MLWPYLFEITCLFDDHFPSGQLSILSSLNCAGLLDKKQRAALAHLILEGPSKDAYPTYVHEAVSDAQYALQLYGLGRQLEEYDIVNDHIGLFSMDEKMVLVHHILDESMTDKVYERLLGGVDVSPKKTLLDPQGAGRPTLMREKRALVGTQDDHAMYKKARIVSVFEGSYDEQQEAESKTGESDKDYVKDTCATKTSVLCTLDDHKRRKSNANDSRSKNQKYCASLALKKDLHEGRSGAAGPVEGTKLVGSFGNCHAFTFHHPVPCASTSEDNQESVPADISVPVFDTVSDRDSDDNYDASDSDSDYIEHVVVRRHTQKTRAADVDMADITTTPLFPESYASGSSVDTFGRSEAKNREEDDETMPSLTPDTSPDLPFENHSAVPTPTGSPMITDTELKDDLPVAIEIADDSQSVIVPVEVCENEVSSSGPSTVAFSESSSSSYRRGRPPKGSVNPAVPQPKPNSSYLFTDHGGLVWYEYQNGRKYAPMTLGRFRCDCKHETKTWGDLSRHWQTLAHSKKEFVCLACGKTYTRADPLKRHLRKKDSCARVHKALNGTV